MRNKDTGKALGIRAGTVKIHLKHIFEKTGIHGRYGLAVSALNDGGMAAAAASSSSCEAGVKRGTDDRFASSVGMGALRAATGMKIASEPGRIFNALGAVFESVGAAVED
jgi:hypothetical protein